MLFRSRFQSVKIKYFADTDTLYIELKAGTVAETRDLDENMLLDVDADGNICAITIEHASLRAGAPEVLYERVPA
jgi:uncharacterized protein YuzE